MVEVEDDCHYGAYLGDLAASVGSVNPMPAELNCYDDDPPAAKRVKSEDARAKERMASYAERSFKQKEIEEGKRCPNSHCPRPDDLDIREADGHMVCFACGMVVESCVISEEAEYRLFADDDSCQERVRIGESYNIYQAHDLTNIFRGRSLQIDRAERKYIEEGESDIKELMRIIMRSACNSRVLDRAIDLFRKQHMFQLKQKQGEVVMSSTRTGGMAAAAAAASAAAMANVEDKKAAKKTDVDQESASERERKKFSRRKQFALACYWRSLYENKIEVSCTHDEMERLLPGQYVSRDSLSLALRDLDRIEEYTVSKARERTRAVAKKNMFDITPERLEEMHPYPQKLHHPIMDWIFPRSLI